MAMVLCLGSECDMLCRIGTDCVPEEKDKERLSKMMLSLRTLLLPLILLMVMMSTIYAAPLDNQWINNKRSLRNDTFKVLFIGDSIFSGYGLLTPETQSVTAVLENMFERDYYSSATVLYKSMSYPGETTSGIVTRIKQAVALGPDVVVLAIGGNDALRAVDPDIVYNNLNVVLQELTRAGIYTLFVGMQAPHSLGYDYMSRFNGVYDKLAQKYPVVFMPFLLEDVAGKRMLNQRDGIHPTPEGHTIIAHNMAPYLERMLKNIRKKKVANKDAVRRREYMIRKNKASVRAGRRPLYSKEQIDALKQ